MNASSLRVAACVATFLVLCSGTASAADDHGHSHDAPPAAAGPALPRFAAVSESFELVGVLQGRQLTLYLDRFADNSPVKDAQLALELDGVKVPVSPHGEGEFEVTLAAAPGPGVVSVSAAVVAGAESDLLAGELEIREAAQDTEAAQRPRWQRVAMGGVGVLLALAFLAWGFRRMTAARALRAGGAA